MNRTVIFIVLLVLVALPALAITIQFQGLPILGFINTDLGSLAAFSVVRAMPLVLEDASLVGQAAPASVAVALVLFAPRRTEKGPFWISVLVAGLGWALYLHLSVLLSDGTPTYRAVLTTLDGEIPSATDGMASLQSFASAVRVFYLVVGATMLGLKIKGEAKP